MMGDVTDERPLRRLNLFAIPMSIGLAVWATSFWLSLLIAAVSCGTVALVLVLIHVGRLKEQIKQHGQTKSLAGLSADIQLADPSLWSRFIIMQSISGVLIGPVWFAIGYGIRSILT